LPDSTNAGFIDEELVQCSPHGRKEKEILLDREKRSRSPDREEIGTRWKQFIYNVDFFTSISLFDDFTAVNGKIASGDTNMALCVYMKDDGQLR
jgi:hypothetical protein